MLNQVNFEGMSHSYAETVNKGDGHIEIRCCWMIDDALAFDYIRHFQGWTDLNSTVHVQWERRLAEPIANRLLYQQSIR
jgi:hypothetical protein